jgi:hypothetical protein
MLENVDGLTPVRSYGWERRSDGTAWLWLEDLGDMTAERWPISRYELAARQLGELNAGFALRPLPEARWLTRNFARFWVNVVVPATFPHTVQPSPMWERPSVRRVYGDAMRDRVLQLWGARERLLRGLDRLPQTVCHFDAHRHNLCARGDETVAIDWGLMGIGAIGEDAGHAVGVTIEFERLNVEEAHELADACYQAYVGGLGRAAQPRIRIAFLAALSLRTAFSSLDLWRGIAADEGDEEAAATLANRASLAPFYVGCGEEALALL